MRVTSPEPSGPPLPAEASGDDVDTIVAAWQRERPDLDVTPLQILSRVSRLARRLDLARSSAFAGFALESWEFDVLSALRRAGHPYRLSPGQLVDETLVTSGTMTNRIDRLQQRLLVRRLPSPGDRRGVLVELTQTGVEVVDGAMSALLDRERVVLADLSAAEQSALAGYLRTIQATLA